MQLAPLLTVVGKHLGAGEDVPAHLGIQLHHLLRCIAAAAYNIVEAVAMMSMPELGLEPGGAL